MNFRSHTRREIAEAIAAGGQAWMLDTGTDGADDVLVGELNEVVSDLLDHLEIEALPEGWELTRFEADWLD